MKDTVRIFKALADPNRLRILKMLESRPLCVCEITAVLGLATSTVSKHLSILRTAGLIMDFKKSKWVNYSLERNPGSPELRKSLGLVKSILDEDPIVTKDRKETGKVDRNRICGTDRASCGGARKGGG